MRHGRPSPDGGTGDETKRGTNVHTHLSIGPALSLSLSLSLSLYSKVGFARHQITASL